MSAARPPSAVKFPPLEDLLAEEDIKSCCAMLYEHPGVRWLLGGELHPGGTEATRRALQLAGVGPGDRLLDVACGDGASALLAARERGCRAVGLEYGQRAVEEATAAARHAGMDDRVSFQRGDAEQLPYEDESFDAVLCECSLCTFSDKTRAVGELRRVLRSGGQLALCDVVADDARLGSELRGPLATLACVGEALPRHGYERLLSSVGLSVRAVESREDDAATLARRVQDRLRGMRLLGIERIGGTPLAISEAIELVGAARRAIEEGMLGYAIFIAQA